MTGKWLAFGLATILAISGSALSVDASAQQQKKAASSKASAKSPAKKAAPTRAATKRPPAKKAPAKKVTQVPPRVTTVPTLPLEIPAGGNTIGAHAAIYAAYVTDVDNLAVRSVLSGSALTTSTERIARHLNSERLALGIVAYGASWAATHDQFVTEARKAADYFGRDAFIAKLRREYSYARVLPGGEDAAKLAARAVLADAAKVQGEADDFKQAAYDWQALAWGKLSTADAIARNTALRNLVAPVPATEVTLALSNLPETSLSAQLAQSRADMLQRHIRIAGQANREAVVLPEQMRAWSPIDRMVSVAALMAIGAPVDKRDDTEALMRDPRLVSCVNSARLNLQMCTAATKQPFERSFCLAEHPLGEIAKCMAKTVN